MKLKVTLLILLFNFPCIVKAQKIWTLEDCIKYAWENNLGIQQRALGAEQTKNTLLQSRLALAPTFAFQVGETVNWGRTVDLTTFDIVKNKRTMQTRAAIGGTFDLFTGLKKIQTIKQNKILHDIAIQEVEKLKNESSIQITRAYLNVLLAQEVYYTAVQSRESVQKQCENTRILVDAGSQPFSSLLEIESQLATENVQVVEAENNIRTHLLALKQLLDLSHDTDFTIAVPKIEEITVFNPAPVEDMYDISQSLPEIKKAEYNLKSQERALKIARSGRYPILSLQYYYASTYSDSPTFVGALSDSVATSFFGQLWENRNPYIALNLSIPIFNGWQVNTNIKNAEIALKVAQLEKKNSEQTLFKEIQQAANDALSSFQQMEANKKNMKAMEESFRYVQQKFDVGMLNGTDYTVSKTNLFKSQSKYLQSKYQHVLMLKILDFYKGIPITL